MNPTPPDNELATGLADLTETLTASLTTRSEDLVGRRFGRFRLLRELGQGGMGRVYLAEQSGPVTRLVAIKLLTGRRLDSEARHRFDIERAILARMRHPAIARLIEAGTTSDGMPFFAMDYIDGPPLDRYLRDRHPDIDTRVSLLIEVARAVAHAHRQGLVHCDLKPGNVLVQCIDETWQPRLIDFGIARSIDAADQGELSGTPGYMSPEQATPGACVDMRTDVHALGALLFEATNAQRLRDPLEINGKPAEEIRHRIREGWRTRWPGCPPEGVAMGRFRWRELGRIVDMALADDPGSRYPSADAFADDLSRWRHGEALTAMPAQRGYRIRCWLRRHRAVAALSMVLLLAVVTGWWSTLTALQRMREQRDEVVRRERALAQTVHYQRELLEGIDLRRFASQLVVGLVEKQARSDVETGRNDATLLGRQLQALAPVDVARSLLGSQWLDPAASLLDGGDADPKVLADMHLLLARINRRLSRLEEATIEIGRAREAYGQVADAESMMAADLEAARIVQSQGNASDALARLESVLTDIRARLHELSPLRLEAEEAYGTALVNQGRYADALAVFGPIISAGREAGRNDAAFRGLVALEERTRLYAAGLCDTDLLARLQQTRDEWEGLDDPGARAGSHYNLGSCLFWRGEYRAALAEFERSVSLFRQFGGDYHPLLASLRSMRNLSALGAGDLGGLEPALSLAVADAIRSSGAGSVAALTARQTLAELWSRQGRAEQALGAYRQLLRDGERLAQANPSLLNSWRTFYGQALRRAGRVEEARTVLAAAERECARLQGSDQADCLSLQIDLLNLPRNTGTKAPDTIADLCARVDSIATSDALLRSRCTALWLKTLASSGAPSTKVDALRSKRLGWLDVSRLNRYGDEDAAELSPWVAARHVER